MERLQTSKFELMPTGEQTRRMRQFAGACRFVFNRALALQKQSRETGGSFIGYVAMARHLTAWRNAMETPWLADAPVHPQQQALKDLERAYGNFFAKRAAFPRFRKKGERDSFRYPDPKQIRLDAGNGRISLPKLGWLRYRNSRAVAGEVRSVTVSQRAGKWFVSILTKREVEQSIPNGPAVDTVVDTAIGIDVGVARFATLSDGSYLAPLNSFRTHEQRLAKYQRRMARKVKGSSNWKMAKARVARIHARIADARNDFLHKASATISKNHALIVLEDLQVRNMTRSASGTADDPGCGVRAKAGLNRAILDQGWGEFRRQLEYKAAWRGGFVVAVPAAHTSQACPRCDHVSKENRRTQALFACVACGYANHADHVGAINVLGRGQRLFACGGRALSGHPVKQEPAEATARVTA
jgi:putative transposase